MKYIVFIFCILISSNAYAALAIDGYSSTAAAATTLSTSSSNDVIIAIYISISGTSSPTPTDTSGLTWTKRVEANSGGTVDIAEWYAISSGTLTSDVITFAGSSRVTAYGISGANISSPFDTNISLPASVVLGSGTTIGSTISTSNANDMIITNLRNFTSLGTVTYPSGESSIGSAGGNQANGYRTTSTTQSSVSESYTITGSLSNAAMLTDAIVAASASSVKENLLLTIP